jgi:hypothetical protein
VVDSGPEATAFFRAESHRPRRILIIEALMQLDTCVHLERRSTMMFGS